MVGDNGVILPRDGTPGLVPPARRERQPGRRSEPRRNHLTNNGSRDIGCSVGRGSPDPAPVATGGLPGSASDRRRIKETSTQLCRVPGVESRPPMASHDLFLIDHVIRSRRLRTAKGRLRRCALSPSYIGPVPPPGPFALNRTDWRITLHGPAQCRAESTDKSYKWI